MHKEAIGIKLELGTSTILLVWSKVGIYWVSPCPEQQVSTPLKQHHTKEKFSLYCPAEH